MIEQEFKKLGYSVKEAKAYILLVEIGSQPASVIARLLDIPRSSAQFILNQLVKKQIVVKSLKENVTYYCAESPSYLKKLLRTEKQSFLLEMEKKENTINNISSNIKLLKKRKFNETSFCCYDDVTNVIKSYFTFLEAIPKGATIYNYCFPADETNTVFRKGMSKFIHERIKKNIKVKTICGLSEDSIRLFITDKYHFRETLISFEKISKLIFSEALIYDNCYLVSSYHEGAIQSYLIRNQDSILFQKHLFEMAWEKAKMDHEKIIKRKDVKKIIEKFSGIEDY